MTQLSQLDRQGIPIDTRPLEIRILDLINDSERVIDRGMDWERLLCRVSGGGDVLEQIDRLLQQQPALIFADPDKTGYVFYRLTSAGKTRLREFERSQALQGKNR